MTSNRDRRLMDRVAVVTGGAQGIGLGIASRLAAEGASVVLADVKLDTAKAAADRIVAEGGRATALEVDIRDDASTAKLAARVNELHGRCEILVNNAAIKDSSGIAAMTMKRFQEVIDINQNGAVRVTLAMLPLLRQGGQGRRILNIASILGLRGWPGTVPYATSKGAIVNFTRALACDLAPEGILVNALAPGFVDTADVDPGGRLARIRLGLVPRHLREVRTNSAAPLRDAGRHGRTRLLPVLRRLAIRHRADPARRRGRFRHLLARRRQAGFACLSGPRKGIAEITACHTLGRLVETRPPGSMPGPAFMAGRIAQLVEQLTLNQRVQGSNPCAPTKQINHLEPPYFLLLPIGVPVGFQGCTDPGTASTELSGYFAQSQASGSCLPDQAAKTEA